LLYLHTKEIINTFEEIMIGDVAEIREVSDVKISTHLDNQKSKY